MVSVDERFIITYNGEVYSHRPIANEFAARGHKFRGYSDTEVISRIICRQRHRCDGRANDRDVRDAHRDRRERTLTLIRDRLGIKPLYWAKFGKLFLFGSGLKSLRAHPGWTPHITRTRWQRSCDTVISRHRIQFMKAFTSLSPARSSLCRGKASHGSRAPGTLAQWRGTEFIIRSKAATAS